LKTHKVVKTIGAAILLLSVFRDSFADDSLYSFPRTERHILPIAPGKTQVKACRAIPKGITAVWEPTDADADSLEALLLGYLNGSMTAPPRRSYGRQYIGIVVNGKRLIYGNFYPPSSNQWAKKIESTRPVATCDGGRLFWGIVFDPSSKTFSEMEFNGDI